MDPRETFLQHLIAPFKEDEEARLSARNLLASRLKEADAAALERANVTLERFTAKRARWRLRFLLLVSLTSLILVGIGAYHGYRTWQLIRAVVRFEDSDLSEDWLNEFAETLPPAERERFLGDGEPTPPAYRWKRSWEENPDDLLLLGDHIEALSSNGGRDDTILSLKAGMKLDPDNAWFDLKLASLYARKALERDRAYRGSRSPAGVFSRRIADQESFDLMIVCMDSGARKKTYRNWSAASQLKRFRKLPPPSDVWDFFSGLHYRRVSDVINYDGLWGPSGFRAEYHAYNKEEQKLAVLYDNLIRIAALYENSESGSYTQLGTIGCIVRTQSDFEKLRLNGHLNPELEERVKVLTLEYKGEFKPWYHDMSDSFLDEHAGLISQSSDFYLTGDVAARYTLAEVEPERTLFQTLLEIAMALLAAPLCVLFGVFLFFHRYPGSKSHRLPARALTGLIPLRTCLLLSLISLGSTLLFYWAISRLTPLGCRDYNVWAFRNFYETFPFSAQIAASFILFLGLLVFFHRLHFHRVFSRIGLTKRRRSWWWLSLIPLALLVPFFGLIRYDGVNPFLRKLPDGFSSTLTAYFVLPFVITLGVVVFRGLSGQPERRIARFLLAKSLGYSLIISSLLFLALVPLLKSVADQAVRRDTFFRVDLNDGYFSRLEKDYEEKASSLLRPIIENQLEMMEDESTPR